MLDKVIFAKNMAVLAEVYDKTLTEALQNIYYAVLKDMNDEDFKQAVKRLLQERVFATFPKPAEILSLSKAEVLDAIIDATTAEAKRLISACETMNTILFKECNNIGVPFEDYVMDYEFNNLQDSTKGLLSAVKPYSDYKRLIVNIRRYQTSSDALNAFKQAIIQVGKSEYAMIENKKVSGMIGGIKNETTHNF
jgi:hypothetical protein